MLIFLGIPRVLINNNELFQLSSSLFTEKLIHFLHLFHVSYRGIISIILTLLNNVSQ